MRWRRQWWRGWTAAVGWTVFFLGGLLIGILASAYVIDRRSLSPDASPGVTSFVVEQGTLGRDLRLPAVSSWPVLGTIRSPAGGLITEIVSPSGLLEAGDIVLRVNERPMVLIPGEIPAFRDMSVGIRGRDVAALNSYLIELGYVIGDEADRFSEATEEAVRVWQEDLGLQATGVVTLGDVLIVDPGALEAPFRWTDSVDSGASLAAGSPILERLGESPELTVELGGSSLPQLEVGLQGVAHFPNGGQRDVSVAAFESSQGHQTAILAAENGSLCVIADCVSLVPPVGETAVDVEFILVPTTTGPMLPVAAIQTDAAGRAFVQLADGTRRPVSVKVASGGLAIVDGVLVGEAIALP
jgi:peptidoglycan hydrolase-like protein with peptidoglycan-binding domain